MASEVMSTQTHYETVLKAVDEPYAVLPLQQGATVLVTQRGTRVLGIFPAPGSDNLLWTNSNAFESAARWADFVAQGNWNLGGERIWIAPEIQYNVRDRADFWGTLKVPSAIDPGHYTLEQKPDCVHLHSQMRLDAYDLAEGQQDLDVSRWISPIPDPLTAVTPYDGDDNQVGRFLHYVAAALHQVVVFDLCYNRQRCHTSTAYTHPTAYEACHQP
jgi:hypothetical protein